MILKIIKLYLYINYVIIHKNLKDSPEILTEEELFAKAFDFIASKLEAKTVSSGLL